jgi:hypothetical protein
MIDVLSKRAPSIAVFTMGASLIFAWVRAPVWLPTMLAIVVASLALLLFAARGGRHATRGFNHNRNWLAWEFAGKGTPSGYYLLGFFSFVTIMLTGFQSSYAMPAWAAFALGIVWGIANRRYPAEEEADL